MNFELERFAWTAGALELSGRWRSDTPRRFRHVRLVVEEGGRRRRLAPAQQTPLRAGPDGESWAATFPWKGDEPPEAPLLEAGQSLLVELPAPTRVAAAAPAAAAAPSPDVEALRAELQAERELVAALKRRLAEERSRLADVQAEEAAAHRQELAEAWKAAQELEAEREAVAREREELAGEREAVAREREALAAERAAAPAEPAPPPEAEPELPAEPEAAASSEQPAAEPATRHRWSLGQPATAAGAAPGPRSGGSRHALELPRQPDDHVRGRNAPLAVRIIAVALCAGVLLMLAIILGAIF